MGIWQCKAVLSFTVKYYVANKWTVKTAGPPTWVRLVTLAIHCDKMCVPLLTLHHSTITIKTKIENNLKTNLDTYRHYQDLIWRTLHINYPFTIAADSHSILPLFRIGSFPIVCSLYIARQHSMSSEILFHQLCLFVQCRPTWVHDLSVSTHCQAHPCWMILTILATNISLLPLTSLILSMKLILQQVMMSFL